MAAAALLLTGCAYSASGNNGAGAGIDNPVERKLTWFSYLDAADIRSSCAAAGPDQYRIVYNGQYYDQVRSYEAIGGSSPSLSVRARGASGNLTEMGFGSFEELLGPWGFRKSEVSLSTTEWASLRDLLHRSGYAAGSQAGLRLNSQEFYWLVAGCQDGRFSLNAWADKPRANPLTHTAFLDFLLKHDATGVGYRPPHPVTYAEMRGDGGGGSDRNYGGAFTITVYDDGIGRAGI
jgi:hypothetical protein